MAAAYLDYRDVAELTRAVTRGEAPAPTSFHGTGRKRVPVWSKYQLDCHATPERRAEVEEPASRDLAALV